MAALALVLASGGIVGDFLLLCHRWSYSSLAGLPKNLDGLKAIFLYPAFHYHCWPGYAGYFWSYGNGMMNFLRGLSVLLVQLSLVLQLVACAHLTWVAQSTRQLRHRYCSF